MKRLALLVPVALALAACATDPAEDPVQVRLNDVDTRLGKVERVITNQSLLDLSRRIDTLEAQLRELRGNTEVLQNGADGLKRQQRDLYADLDKRIAALEAGLRTGAGTGAGGAGAGGGPGAAAADAAGPGGGSSSGSGASGAPASAAEPASDDQAAYARAIDLLKGGDYPTAIARLQAFMKQYPQSSLIDNAQYWIGEAYYVTHDYEQAASAFRAVGERWPNSRKAGDALLKLGFTQFEQKHYNDARATLSQVVQRYPGSDAARLASERLQKMPLESH
jgi:tol-pal system protein YbgF